MLKWLKIACCCILWSSSHAQDSLKVVTWEQAMKASPDTIYAIDASHLKLETVPEELLRFTNLVYLDLSKNKLTELPSEFGNLKKLRWLSVEKNKLSTGINEIFQLTQLRYLNIGKNEFDYLPVSIGYMSSLEVFSLWANPISELPQEIMNCKKLKQVDMRGILTGPSFQASWQERMPQVIWEFDAPCHCVE